MSDDFDDLASFDIDLSQYMGEYLAELNEQLEELNDNLLELEASGGDNPDVTRNIFRLAHTIKGSAATMGFDEIASVSHAFEDLLGEVQAHRVHLDDEVVEAMLAAFDHIRARASALTNGEDFDEDPTPLVTMLRRLAGPGGSAPAASAPPAPSPVEPAPTSGDPLAPLDLDLPPGIDLEELARLTGDPMPAPSPAPAPVVESAPPPVTESFEIDLSQYMGEYMVELEEQLEGMSSALLHLEGSPSDPELIRELFRLSHTIKGAAATMGFDQLAKLSEAFEDLLEVLRAGDIFCSPEVFQHLLDGLDGMTNLASTLPEANPNVDVARLSASLRSILTGEVGSAFDPESVAQPLTGRLPAQGAAAPGPAPATPAAPSLDPLAPLPSTPTPALVPDESADALETLTAARAELRASGDAGAILPEPLEEASGGPEGDLYKLTMRFSQDQEMRSVRAFLVLNHIQEVAELLSSVPTVSQVEEDQLGESLEMVVRTSITVQEIENILSFGEANSTEIEALEGGETRPVSSAPPRPTPAPPPAPEPPAPVAPPPPQPIAAPPVADPVPPPAPVAPAAPASAPRQPAPPPPSLATPLPRVDPTTDILRELTEEMKSRAVEALNEDLNVLEVKVLLNDAGERSGARALTILRYLRQNSEVIHCKPSMDPNDTSPGATFRGSLQILIATDKEVEHLRELALAEEVEKTTFTPIALDGLELVTTEEAHRRSTQRQEQAGKVVRSPTATRAEAKGSIATVRVTVDRLDHLMNLVAELVISKTQLQQLVMHYHHGSDADQLLHRLVEVNGRLGRITTELQEGIMKARMVQIGQVFFRFTRLVRDLSKSLGKNVEFLIEGTETELDKTVIDEIGDPLMHLIRNALDHGIEAPDVRQKKGKPPKGILLLKANHAGDHIVVETADDGRGMDAEKIRASAIRKGVVTEAEARKLNNSEVFNLIFAPGFSTAQEVTSVSGRGVGMDVVKTTIEGLGGEIQVKSEVNVGTSIQIKLPLTLAIIQGLLIWVGGECFAVPLSTVKETIQLDEKSIHNFNGYPAMVFRGEMITLIFLDDFFGIPRVERKKRFVVFAGVDEEKVGLVVDSLVGRREIVIKSLDKTFMDVRGFAGATVLGDGQVSLILDIPALMDQSRVARESLHIAGN